MVLVAVVDSELGQDAATCVSTVRSVSQSLRAIPMLVRPSAMSASTSRSLGVSVLRGSSCRPGPIKSCDHFGVERCPTGGDAAQRVEEVVDVEDPVLE